MRHFTRRTLYVVHCTAYNVRSTRIDVVCKRMRGRVCLCSSDDAIACEYMCVSLSIWENVSVYMWARVIICKCRYACLYVNACVWVCVIICLWMCVRWEFVCEYTCACKCMHVRELIWTTTYTTHLHTKYALICKSVIHTSKVVSSSGDGDGFDTSYANIYVVYK